MNLLLISVLSLLLQQQEGPPSIILKSEGFTLEANSIDSKPTEYGIIYVIKSQHGCQLSFTKNLVYIKN